MRDRPNGEELARLARELGGEAALVARCLAIAERERGLGAAAFAECRAALAERYGESGDRELLSQLAAEVRAGANDREVLAILWAITVQKLRDSNPEFLAASELARGSAFPEGCSLAARLGGGREASAARLDVARQPTIDQTLRARG